MTDEFKEIIERDILRCKDAIEHGHKAELVHLHTELKSKYSPIITDFGKDLYSIFYDDSGNARKANLEVMQQKLELFRAMGYENVYANVPSGVTYNNTNQIISTFNVTFENAKEKIENLSALKDDEINDILSKIDELEIISKSSERKTKKWEMARDIVKWVADKGIDVAKILLPLILKVGE